MCNKKFLNYDNMAGLDYVSVNLHKLVIMD